MKNNHILIDYENVQPDLAGVLSQPIFKVWVFIGAQPTKVKVDLLDLLQRKGADARVIKMASIGRNALDFHMSYYMGELAAKEPEAYMHVVSKDTGIDPLISHLRARGIEAARWADIYDIPILKAPAAVSEDEKLSRIVEYLVRRGQQRPASMKTLVGSTAALFQPRLAEGEAEALIEQLRINGVLEVVGTRIRYGLPD